MMRNFLRKLYKIICFIFCAITFLVSCLMTFLYFVTDGSFENREESSLPVKFYVSSDLISIPVYGVLGIPSYSTDDELMYDGFHVKSYKSNFTKEEIQKKYSKYFSTKRCSGSKNDKNTFDYVCLTERYKVVVHKRDDNVRVSIFQDIIRK